MSANAVTTTPSPWLAVSMLTCCAAAAVQVHSAQPSARRRRGTPVHGDGAVARTLKRRLSRSCTWMAPPRIEKGAMPKSDWLNSSVPATLIPPALADDRGRHGEVRRTPCSVIATASGASRRGPVDAKGREREALHLEHLVEHVGAGAGDVGRAGLGVQARLGPQRRLVDREFGKGDEEVGTAFARRDVALHARLATMWSWPRWLSDPPRRTVMATSDRALSMRRTPSPRA